MHWLATPISGSATHSITMLASWHGRAMVLGWSILIPLGIVSARFLKVTPRQNWPDELDNRAWWQLHRILQTLGVISATAGVALMWGFAQGATLQARIHGLFGWTLLFVGWLQIGLGIFRGSKGGPTEPALRGDHYDMTPHRRRFEFWHKLFGWSAMPLAIVTTALGLWIADAPRWMVLVIALWWLALAGVSLRLQLRGLAVDTYQAIWGPDADHPGNRMSGHGWGMKRHDAESLAHAWRRNDGEGGKGK